MSEVKRKKALIVTGYRYPNGDAGAIRQHTFAKIFEALNYDVTVVSMGKHTNFSFEEFEGINYISFRNAKETFFCKVKNKLEFTKRLKSLLKETFFDVILVAEIIPFALFFLKKYSKKNKIKLLYDSVEWYSAEEFKNGKLSINYINNNNLNTKWLDKQFSVISISTFLEEHFNSKGVNTVRIPVIMDIGQIPCVKETDQQKTVFLYAGSPGKKDFLAVIINAFALLPKEKLEKLELRLIGVRKEQLVTLCGVQENFVEYLGNSLVCLGRVSREEVFKNLSQADFTVLLRSETQRYAKAGFPTKVVESLATATPIITNLTSDLGLYLKDGYNSFVARECSADAFAKSICDALAVSGEEKTLMYANSRETAEKNFDYRLYVEKTENLIG